MKPRATAPRATATMDQVRQIQGSRSAAKRDLLGLVFPEPCSIIWGASGAVKNRSHF